jgi:hypothetical protein
MAYVLNIQAIGRGMLHLAACKHLQFGPDEDVSLTAKPKVVSTELKELIAEASHRRIQCVRCSTCNP